MKNFALLFVFLLAALSSVMGATLIKDGTYQGTAQTNQDLGGHSLLNGSAGSGFTVPWADVTGSPFSFVSGKTLTISNSLTLSGVDGSSLNIGSGGSLAAISFSASGADLVSNTVTNAKMAQMASMTFKGNVTSATANPADVAMPSMGYKNILIGGDFSTNPWQRGTSFTITPSTFAYQADRWISSGGPPLSISKITGIGLPGFGAAMRVQRPAGNAVENGGILAQAIRSANVIPLQGKTVTLSLWLRAGANFSANPGLANPGGVTIDFRCGTGLDEGAAGGITGSWTGWSVVLDDIVVPTASWQRFAVTFTLPATATEGVVMISIDGKGTAGAADYCDVAGVQLEANPYATAFEARPAELELALCQAYYRTSDPGAAVTNLIALGQCDGPTGVSAPIVFQSPMRVAPTIAFIGAASSWVVTASSGAGIACTTVGANTISNRSFQLALGVASGLVAGNASVVATTGASIMWTANAEL